MPYQLLGVLLHTMAMSGLSRVRTELFQLLVIPSLAPHPVQTNRESTGHGDLGNLPSPPQGQGGRPSCNTGSTDKWRQTLERTS